MNEGSLQEDLLAIPGVEGAEVEGSADKPAGLRIRIAEGADQQAVGGAIRRVLTSHGLGTDTRLPGEAPAQSAPVSSASDVASATPVSASTGAAPSVAVVGEGEGSVIDLTDRATEAEDEDEGIEGEESALEIEDGPTESAAEEAASDEDEPEPLVTPTAPGPAEAASDSAKVPAAAGMARLASVAVEEGRDGIVVTVASTDGSSVQQVAASTEGGVESAVVKATVRLALPEAPDASVIDVDDRRIEGVDIVMIVLDVDGHVYAGSAVVGAGRSFALGRATWAALNI